MVLHRSLSDNQSPQVSSTPLTILVDINIGPHSSSSFQVLQSL